MEVADRQFAEGIQLDVGVRKGTTLQLAEKLHLDADVRRGTTSVVPQAALDERYGALQAAEKLQLGSRCAKGHDFSRAISCLK
jgi:hypothetical protein